MPNIKSACKRVKVTEKKTAANKMKKSEIRTVIKKATVSVAASADNSAELMKDAQVALDRAASKGYIHKNAAARKKSRLAKAANKAE
ncbi:MAG TPA: 30S ribosomal protein S20 [Bacillota bacterium]|mgnify:CR=1 FL=1|nr:30S ribosomal protein S20 [Bacillota bacterium]HPE38296.1 30S ribosomal protein S20 [Bacillota bacterium]